MAQLDFQARAGDRQALENTGNLVGGCPRKWQVDGDGQRRGPHPFDARAKLCQTREPGAGDLVGLTWIIRIDWNCIHQDGKRPDPGIGAPFNEFGESLLIQNDVLI